MYVPSGGSLRGNVISLFHDNHESGHFGALKTTELVSRDLYWAALDLHVRRCVSACTVCHRINAPRHARHGIKIPWEMPQPLWEGITMDFVTDLPELMGLDYTRILVIVNRLTKMAIKLLCRNNISTSWNWPSSSLNPSLQAQYSG
jgi:hypothetical protein